MKKLIFIFLFILLDSCDSGTTWRDGNYQVIWIDTPELSLCLKVGEGSLIQRVGPEVIAVGSNNKFIVVKQRNTNTKQISYYYLEKEKDGIYKNAEEVTQGPFSEDQFKKLSNELDLPKFTKEFSY